MAASNQIARLPKANTMHDLEVILISSHQQINVTNRIGHVVSRNKQQAVMISNQWQGELKNLCQQAPAHVITTRLADGLTGRHFMRLNDKLWIPYAAEEEAVLRVFTLDGTDTGESIVLSRKVGRVNAIVQTRHSHAKLAESEMAAIAGDSGVFTITVKGHIVQSLSRGSFSDVCLYEGSLYALEYKLQQVLRFDFGASGWQQVSAIDVKHTESGVHDTLCVTDGRVHVACWWGDEIQSYSMTGEKLGRYRDTQCGRAAKGGNSKKGGKSMKKSTIAVQTANPRLCGSDSTGALLYCDSANSRVEMLAADQQWGVTVLQGLSVQPVHVIQQASNSMIILAADNSLVRFTFQ